MDDRVDTNQLYRYRFHSTCAFYSYFALFFSMFAHCRDQLNTHLDNVQGDLEALKEFLRSGGGDDYQVDANTLLNVSSFKKIDFVFPYDCLTQTQIHNTHFTHTRLHMHTHTHTNQEKKKQLLYYAPHRFVFQSP